MSTYKRIDIICVLALGLAVILTLIFCSGSSWGLETSGHTMGYENRLFDCTRVHTIDIVMEDWESFIETCEDEEYVSCAVIIDGEAYKNVGIRAKGNTSLSTVASMGSSRYSFKIEFDHYDTTKSYHGLDKVCLNNIIQDNTYMKDYLAYTWMADFGVDAPLCSYAYITVNGEDWGLYLAVEGVEESFLQRNYGSDYGELYKPDSQSEGAGGGMRTEADSNLPGDIGRDMAGGQGRDMAGGPGESMAGGPGEDIAGSPERDMTRGPGGGMGSDDVKLKYIDDDADSYANIFDNAKTDVSEADQARLIRSLKSLSENRNIEEIIDTNEVIRYFVVHNFLCNGDSYTGTIVHNYYLYEEEGQLSMIPWDYNLAFGGFGSADATAAVNTPMDTPVSGTLEDRPMVSWIFEEETYTNLYHGLFGEWLNSVDFVAQIEEISALISTYVEKDPTKFCTYEEYEKGVLALQKFCTLRAESLQGQLNGTIPSTKEGQEADSRMLVEASSLNLSDMGTMEMGERGREVSFDALPARDQIPENVTIPVNEPSTAADDRFVLLFISAAVLIAGLAVARKYKRRV